MTPYQFARLLVSRKDETYPLPQLPPANPDDFIVWGEGELDKALEELEASDNTLSGSLTDAGFGSFGPM